MRPVGGGSNYAVLNDIAAVSGYAAWGAGDSVSFIMPTTAAWLRGGTTWQPGRADPGARGVSTRARR